MAAERAGRNWYLVESLGFGALVAMYMWRWQAASTRSWWALAAWLVISAALRRDTPQTLGWRGDNLWTATRRAIPFFVAADSAAGVSDEPADERAGTQTPGTIGTR